MVVSMPDLIILRAYGLTPKQWQRLTEAERIQYRDAYYKQIGL